MGKIYVGTNYHPHDHSFERILADIQEMKKNNLDVVRIGHLCWDSFEKEEDKFDFEWFDKVVTSFAHEGIKVIIDIPTRPAPQWLHKKYPEIATHNKDGVRMRPITRYMEDVGNPDFQKYAFRFARQIVQRYAKAPNLMAFGLCNEIGSGFSSYSESAEQRFRLWLKDKYQSVDVLNRVWATQRWSRRVNSFDEVIFPINSEKNGAPESFLDMKRFFSDELGQYLIDLKKIVAEVAPGVTTTSNHWAENKKVGFDYFKFAEGFVETPGIGFYPGINPEDKQSIVGACMYLDHRITETQKNIWCLEFQTGTNGGFSGPKGMSRMYCYLSLIYRNEMVCSWTWDTMVAGEEQYFFGLLNHDGTETNKLVELRQFGQEVKALEPLDVFPRRIKPRIAIAYSYESNIISDLAANFYGTSATDQILCLYQSLFDLNVDCNMVDLRKFSGEYDVLIIPGIAEMDSASIKNIEYFVRNGGTVLMTAYSAKVNQHNTVFSSPFPGGLTDVFGITISEFGRAFSFAPSVNEGGVEKNKGRIKIKEARILDGKEEVVNNVDYYEIIDTKTASQILTLEVDQATSPACTTNRYGKGQAIYCGIPAEDTSLKILLRKIFADKQINYAESPGVVFRNLGEDVEIFINVTQRRQAVKIDKKHIDLIENKASGPMIIDLPPYGVKLIKSEENGK